MAFFSVLKKIINIVIDTIDFVKEVFNSTSSARKEKPKCIKVDNKIDIKIPPITKHEYLYIRQPLILRFKDGNNFIYSPAIEVDKINYYDYQERLVIPEKIDYYCKPNAFYRVIWTKIISKSNFSVTYIPQWIVDCFISSTDNKLFFNKSVFDDITDGQNIFYFPKIIQYPIIDGIKSKFGYLVKSFKFVKNRSLLHLQYELQDFDAEEKIIGNTTNITYVERTKSVNWRRIP